MHALDAMRLSTKIVDEILCNECILWQSCTKNCKEQITLWTIWLDHINQEQLVTRIIHKEKEIRWAYAYFDYERLAYLWLNKKEK